MRTITYKAVLDRVGGLLQGLSDSSSGSLGLSVADAAVAQRFIGSALREYWEGYPWPEVMAVERRMYRQTYASGSTYAAGDEVFFWGTESYYQALKAVIAGQAPAVLTGGGWVLNSAYWGEAEGSVNGEDWSATRIYVAEDLVKSAVDGKVYQCHTAHTNQQPPNASYWGERTDFVRNIAMEQSWEETEIGQVRRIYNADPRVRDVAALMNLELKFDLFDPEGAIVRGEENVVWVEFWKRVPELRGNVWAAGSVYSAGTVVYFASGSPGSFEGDFWECAATTSAGESPATHPAKWSRQEIPWVLGEMVAWRVMGEMARMHGGGGGEEGLAVAGRALAMAEGLRVEAVDGVERRQGQGRQMRVLSR